MSDVDEKKSNESKESLFLKHRNSKIVLSLLCIFLGIFGVHRFYVGRIWTALIYLFMHLFASEIPPFFMDRAILGISIPGNLFESVGTISEPIVRWTLTGLLILDLVRILRGRFRTPLPIFANWDPKKATKEKDNE